MDAATRLARLLEKHFEPVQAVKRFKRFAFYFSANFRFGHTLYTRILKAHEMKEVFEIIEKYFEKGPDLSLRPNMNFFG
jgi:hypothetical protein